MVRYTKCVSSTLHLEENAQTRSTCTLSLIVKEQLGSWCKRGGSPQSQTETFAHQRVRLFFWCANLDISSYTCIGLYQQLVLAHHH